MTTLNLRKLKDSFSISAIISFALGLLIWWLIDHLLLRNITYFNIDPSIIQVILLGFAAWLALLQIALLISGKLFKKILLQLQDIFNPYRKLTSWQQHILYLAFFALVVLSGTGCLIAIC